MKTVIATLLETIVDNGYFFQFECDGEIYTQPTQDILTGFRSDEDPYQGVNAVDDCHILLRKNPKEDKRVYGWILWTNCNDGIEKVCDYNSSLDEKLNLSQVLNDWEDSLNKFIKTF